MLWANLEYLPPQKPPPPPTKDDLASARKIARRGARQTRSVDLDTVTPYDWGLVPDKLYAIAKVAPNVDHPYDKRGLSTEVYDHMDLDDLENSTIATVLWAWTEHMSRGHTVTTKMFRDAFPKLQDPDRRFRATRTYLDRHPEAGFVALRYREARNIVHNMFVPVNASGQIIVTGLPAEVAQNWAQCQALHVEALERKLKREAQQAAAPV